MIPALKKWLTQSALDPEDSARIDRAVMNLNSAGFDDWGMEPGTIKAALPFVKWLYRHYFRVETHGIERVPAGRVLLIANHGGQLPMDGLVVGLSMLLDGHPPRLVRGMVERWFPSLPFVSTLFMRIGQMVGDHRNCRELLEREECVLVFPEGVRGSGKLFSKRYQLQRMGTGFVRLALEARAPIVPVAVIGCEETYPAIFNFKGLARLTGAPYLPVTPFWPLLGPLGAVPLPTKVTLRFGEPLRFNVDPDAPDSVVTGLVEQVRERLGAEIQEGLKLRGEHIFSGAGK
jgi:1-acyl-sn-glycerol-3-phosphate acyltransferase